MVFINHNQNQNLILIFINIIHCKYLLLTKIRDLNDMKKCPVCEFDMNELLLYPAFQQIKIKNERYLQTIQIKMFHYIDQKNIIFLRKYGNITCNPIIQIYIWIYLMNNENEEFDNEIKCDKSNNIIAISEHILCVKSVNIEETSRIGSHSQTIVNKNLIILGIGTNQGEHQLVGLLC